MPASREGVQQFRFVLAILVGMILAYALVQAIEFALVLSLHGSIPEDRATYFALRNDTEVLIARLFYSAAVGLVAGYVAAWIGGRMGLPAGLGLAVVQAGGFSWAMISPNPLFAFTPTWVWVLLILTMPSAIVIGAWLRARHRMDRSRV